MSQVLWGSEDSDYLFTILYDSYLYEQEGAEELLPMFLDSTNYNRSKAIGEILSNYYKVEDSKKKSDYLLELILLKADKEDFNDIFWHFSDAGHVALQDLYKIIKKTSSSLNILN
ncbi:hypothetical protein [Fulvivirga ligni]|uniref:hypothetical protein n=1 Tax=Fulvivirga ligni TaxID=2904246 RepID=UPI001F4820BD|nr:hypothetical protein [Fulvivirga ligni]UII21588.1 hypothetical protein LVD16_27550 [Fulvivirga ligni]